MERDHDLGDIRLLFPPVWIDFQRHKVACGKLAYDIRPGAKRKISGYLGSLDDRKSHFIEQTIRGTFCFDDNSVIILGSYG